MQQTEGADADKDQTCDKAAFFVGVGVFFLPLWSLLGHCLSLHLHRVAVGCDNIIGLLEDSTACGNEKR